MSNVLFVPLSCPVFFGPTNPRYCNANFDHDLIKGWFYSKAAAQFVQFSSQLKAASMYVRTCVCNNECILYIYTCDQIINEIKWYRKVCWFWEFFVQENYFWNLRHVSSPETVTFLFFHVTENSTTWNAGFIKRFEKTDIHLTILPRDDFLQRIFAILLNSYFTEEDSMTAKDGNLWIVVIVKSYVNKQAGSWTRVQQPIRS